MHLANERALPVGPRITQSKHPPLYHATAAVASLGEPVNDFLRANPDVQFQPASGWSPNFFIHTMLEAMPWRGGAQAFHLVRLWSVLLSTLTVAATYALARAAFPAAPWVALAAAALLAGIPEFAFIGGAANNDNAAALFGTLALWGGVAILRGEGRVRAGWWTPLALGLGLLSKTSTLGVWPAVGVAIVAGAVAAHDPAATRPGAWLRAAAASWRRWLVTGLWVGVPALLVAAPWFLRNWRLYGDPLGMALARQTIDVRTTPWTGADTWWLLRGWFVSFWGKFGGAGHIPMAGWIYVLLAALSALAVVGLVRLVIACRPQFPRDAVWVLLLALGSVALVMWRYSLVALGTDQGRLLFPAVGALVTLLAAGWLALIPLPASGGDGCDRRIGRGAGSHGLLGVIRPALAPPPPATVANPVEPVRFGDLTLVGVELDAQPVLYWQLAAQAGTDYRTVLRRRA
ncbi:MAG: glycosyltransferase family 39 protein [Caldilineaceae bacterium]